MAAAQRHRDRDHVPLAALGGAALVHAALLAPLALGALGTAFEAGEDIDGPILLIQLESSPRRSSAASTVATARADAIPPDRPATRLRLPGTSLPPTMGPAIAPPMPLEDRPSAAIDAQWRVRPLQGALPGPVLTCRSNALSSSDRQECAERLAAGANAAARISGSGAPGRDAGFAAQGAEEMARYEAKRAPLGQPDEPECTTMGPITDCGVSIKVKLFSSRDGVLPGLRRRQ